MDPLQQTSPYFDKNDASNCTIKKLKARSKTHLKRKIQDHSPTKRSVAAVKIVQAMDPVEEARKVFRQLVLRDSFILKLYISTLLVKRSVAHIPGISYTLSCP